MSNLIPVLASTGESSATIVWRQVGEATKWTGNYPGSTFYWRRGPWSGVCCHSWDTNPLPLTKDIRKDSLRGDETFTNSAAKIANKQNNPPQNHSKADKKQQPTPPSYRICERIFEYLICNVISNISLLSQALLQWCNLDKLSRHFQSIDQFTLSNVIY